MIVKGKVHKFGNDVNTDEIIPAPYLVTTDMKELGKHCMEGIDETFPKKVDKGDIIIAGRNFGCGSSREHAPLAIKGCGVSLVIAESFARIFYRNSINVGLPILTSKEIYSNVNPGDVLEADLLKGEVKNITQNKVFNVEAFPPLIQEIIEAGGLMGWYALNEQGNGYGNEACIGKG
jgi:3-isopropylmalate/(R)-2-methylmalate dehydratase small subunit